MTLFRDLIRVLTGELSSAHLAQAKAQGEKNAAVLAAQLKEMDILTYRLSQELDPNRWPPIIAEMVDLMVARQRTESARMTTLLHSEMKKSYGR